MAEVLIAESKNAPKVESSSDSTKGAKSGRSVNYSPVPAFVQQGTALDAVMLCIRQHESGNYAEQAHPSGSSGAYQYQPATWRAWSARAGYPGYDRAYLAPAAVQDAVTAYALSHGGAGNWSMRWGNDPCTRGLPGGG